jgi:hypothetical protein
MEELVTFEKGYKRVFNYIATMEALIYLDCTVYDPTGTKIKYSVLKDIRR